jgi:hypothetical protein
MDVLRHYDWPGNNRELQNVIERAAILSSGPALRLPLEELKCLAGADGPLTPRRLVDAERDHILDVFRDVGWVVGGHRGAAQQLGIPRTTLVYKMRKLGIFFGKRVASELNGGFVSESQAERVPWCCKRERRHECVCWHSAGMGVWASAARFDATAA